MRARGALRALALAAALLSSTRARAQEARPEPLVFVVDPKLGVETSVRSIDSVGRLVFRYEDALPHVELGGGMSSRIVRYLGRVAQLLFLDEPLAELTSTVVHEVAGHGGRGRELGLRPTYDFSLPGIYDVLFSAAVKKDAAAYTRYRTSGVVEGTRAVAGTLGGIEANYVEAWWINARIVRAGGETTVGDKLVYATSKLQYAAQFLSPALGRRPGTTSDDTVSYVSELQLQYNSWRAADRSRIAGRVRAGYVWNLLDPTLLYVAWSTIADTLVDGRRTTEMPLPRVRGRSLLLSPRFGLTPFGPEQILDVFAADREARLVDVYGRVGTSGLATYYGAGARVLGVRVIDRVKVGAEVDVWRQPQLLLEERAVFDPPPRVGVNAGLYGDVALARGLALTGKLAAKTSGYVAGLPLEGGPHGYVGISVGW